MFCKNCGTQINDDAKFCTNCGTNISIGNNTNTLNNEQIQNNNAYNDSQYSNQNYLNFNVKNFYIKIKGFKSGLDSTYNWLQYGSFLVPIILAFIVEFILGEANFGFFILLAIAALIIITVLNPKGIFIDLINKQIISNKNMKFNFLKEKVNIDEIKEIKIEKYSVPFILGYNIFDLLLSSRKFDNVSLINDKGERILSTQFVKKGNVNEYIDALKNMCNILNRNDIVFTIDNEVKRGFECLKKHEENNNNN